MDSTLTLAFAMHKNPGAYALLLGSGISQSVGIKTGWEITQDLIQRIKVGNGPDLPEDTGYDKLIEGLGKTQTERNILLRDYFEPTPEERERGVKVPSPAHVAIAKLVKDGYIKIILTTNFDRLIEIALEQEGITPDVIRSEDMLKGAPPIRHSKITIIQLHGDYRDTRTLNTVSELGTYSEAKNTFLDSFLNEYGLIVCGWSAKWDKALRDAIYRISQQWYSTYWVEPYDLCEEAKEVIHFRRAEVIPLKADDFFKDLQAKVEALAKINREHPLTVAVAVERVKKLLPHEHTQIELEDMLRDDAERTYKAITESKIHLSLERNANNSEIEARFRTYFSSYFALCEVPLNMVATVCRYGKGQQIEQVTKIMNRWASPIVPNQDNNPGKKVPALYLLYVIGIAALLKSNWSYFATVLRECRVFYPSQNKSFRIMEEIRKNSIFEYHYRSDSFDPISRFLKDTLRPLFREVVPVDEEFSNVFDLFEMVLTLLSVNSGLGWIPHNATSDEYIVFRKWDHMIDFWKHGAQQGNQWNFLQVFFKGSTHDIQIALTKYREEASRFIRRDNTMTDYTQTYKDAYIN